MRSNSLAAPSFDTGNRFVNDNRPMPRLRLVLRDEKPRLENFLLKHHLRPSANNTQAQVAPRKITVVYDRSASGQTIYAYVNGNPINRNDPYGEGWANLPWIKILIVVVPATAGWINQMILDNNALEEENHGPQCDFNNRTGLDPEPEGDNPEMPERTEVPIWQGGPWYPAPTYGGR
jgi:hypothetical protein